jgi:hypothetical protein
MADPGDGGPWGWRTLGMAVPGDGGPWGWGRTLGMAAPGDGGPWGWGAVTNDRGVVILVAYKTSRAHVAREIVALRLRLLNIRA